MRRAVAAAALAALALTVLPGAALAGTTVKVPGSFATESQVSEDGKSCYSVLTYVWGHIPGAVSYRVQATDTITGSYDMTVEPGFDAAVAEGFPPIGKNLQRSVMNSAGTGVPCPGDLNGGRWTVEVTANFAKESRIVGTVAGADGAPVPGVKVSLRGPAATSATTNSAGAYGKKVKPGRYEVSAGKGYCVAGGGGCDATRRVDVKSGNVEAVNFVAADDEVKLSGGILEHVCADGLCDRLEVRPAAGLTVVAVARGSGEVFGGVSDGGGDYEIEVPVGRYDITVKGRDGQDAASHPLSRAVSAAQDVRHLDFKLCDVPLEFSGDEGAVPDCDRLVEVSGRVVDVDGKGFGGATVEGPGDVAVTPRSGQFRLQVPRGRVGLTAFGEIGLARRSASLNARKRKNALPNPIELQPALAVPAADARQVVVNVDGLPLGRRFPLEFTRWTDGQTLGCTNLNRVDYGGFEPGENQPGARRAASPVVTPAGFETNFDAFCPGEHSVTLSLRNAPDATDRFEIADP